MGSILLAFEPVVIVLHFAVAAVLVLMILLQSGKGDIGAAFGAGGSQTLFGARGAATFLSKLTTVCALVFLMTSLSLATSSKYSASSAGSASTIEEKLKAGTTTETTEQNDEGVMDQVPAADVTTDPAKPVDQPATGD